MGPYTYCGHPIYADIQAALFYPPVLAATIASNWLGADLLPRVLAIATAALVFSSGLCTFALVRRLGARPSAAGMMTSGLSRCARRLNG